MSEDGLVRHNRPLPTLNTGGAAVSMVCEARERRKLRPFTAMIAVLVPVALAVPTGAFAQSLHGVTKTQVIGYKSNGKTVSLLAGERLVVSLKEGSDGGYHWVVTGRPKPSVLKPLSSKSIPPSPRPGVVGGMSTRKLVLKARHQGEATLAMIQLGPGETRAKHSSHDETFTVTVDVR